MTHSYRPRGICPQQMQVTLDDGRIARVQITGGCSGNLQGISRLVEGMQAEEAIARLRGIRCGAKKSSCPDQLAIALTQALEKERQAAE